MCAQVLVLLHLIFVSYFIFFTFVCTPYIQQLQAVYIVYLKSQGKGTVCALCHCGFCDFVRALILILLIYCNIFYCIVLYLLFYKPKGVAQFLSIIFPLTARHIKGTE